MYIVCIFLAVLSLFPFVVMIVNSTRSTFEIQQPDVWIGTDGTQIGLHGGQGWSKVPRIPVIKSLGLNVEGSSLKINYEAEVRE